MSDKMTRQNTLDNINVVNGSPEVKPEPGSQLKYITEADPIRSLTNSEHHQILDKIDPKHEIRAQFNYYEMIKNHLEEDTATQNPNVKSMSNEFSTKLQNAENSFIELYSVYKKTYTLSPELGGGSELRESPEVANHLDQKQQELIKNLSAIKKTDIIKSLENTRVLLNDYKTLVNTNDINPEGNGSYFNPDKGSFLKYGDNPALKPVIGNGHALKSVEDLKNTNFNDPYLDLTKYEIKEQVDWGRDKIHKGGMLLLKDEDGGLIDLKDSKPLDIKIMQNQESQPGLDENETQQNYVQSNETVNKPLSQLTDDEKLAQIPGLSFNKNNGTEGPNNDGGPDFC